MRIVRATFSEAFREEGHSRPKSQTMKTGIVVDGHEYKHMRSIKTKLLVAAYI